MSLARDGHEPMTDSDGLDPLTDSDGQDPLTDSDSQAVTVIGSHLVC